MTTLRRVPVVTLASEGLVEADGSLWIHAASFGRIVYRGEPITLDPALFASFARNFASVRTKVPVDYDHGSTSGAADGTRPVPKAGDVLEVAVVETPAQLTAPMRAQLAKTGRAADASATGLWLRIRPTARALQMIRDREYTEASIAFDDYEDPRTGTNVGPTLVAVALTNQPFLDDMAPIAASRDASSSGSPAAPGQESTTMSTQAPNRIMLALSALLRKPVATDEEAEAGVTELTRRVHELEPKATELTALHAELGVAQTADAIARIRELKAEQAKAATAAKTAEETARQAKVDGFLTQFERKIKPAQRPYFAKALAADVAAGRDDTVKLLEQMPDLAELTRASGGDSGKNVEYDDLLDAEVEKLQQAQTQLSYGAALEMAERNLARKGVKPPARFTV